MSAAIAALVFAAFEAELVRRYRRAGNLDAVNTHSGWACILAGVGLYCALMHWIFG